jgi:hypothetical protein
MAFSRQTFFIFCFLLVATTGSGQVKYGVFAGGNLYRLRYREDVFNDAGFSKYAMAFQTGAYARLPLTEKFSLIPELYYITKNSANEPAGSARSNIRLNYIEASMLLNYQLLKWISLEAGPCIGVRTGVYFVNDVTRTKVGNSAIETLDFAAMAGARFRLTDRFFLIAHYSYGITRVVDVLFNTGSGPSTLMVTEAVASNRGFQLSVAYQIR